MSTTVSRESFDRSKARPGMKLRNTKTKKVGEVRADKHDPTRVALSAIWNIPIRRRSSSGKYVYSRWNLDDVQAA